MLPSVGISFSIRGLALACHEVATMGKRNKDVPQQAEQQHSARELRQELRAMGYRLTGKETYEDLLERGSDMVAIRIKPNGIHAGIADPGGLLWLWLTVATILVIILVFLYF